MAATNYGFDNTEGTKNGAIPNKNDPENPIELVQSSSEEKNAKTEKSENENGSGAAQNMYYVDDVPPWYISIGLGFQHYLTMFGGTISVPILICPALCMEEDDPARGYIISTVFFISGIITFLQSTFGVRLPIIQGGTFSFLVPTFAILNLPHNQCPEGGFGDDVDKTEEWQRRMREVQGAIIVASLFQFIIGFSGLIGIILRYITPLTIAPAVCMIGLSLFNVASEHAATNWYISMSTVVIMILFSQYLREWDIPCYKGKKFALFKLFPVLLTILLIWGICGILTATDVLPEGDPGRTDLKLDLIKNAAWFRVPYPFQWGWPTVTVAGVFGMLAGVLASAIESVGDYYACARLSGAPPPPTHAINRGIGIEGLGCILAGIWGTGNGSTSYSENIGAIGVTKVASRRVIQFGAAIMIVFGCLSKFGAFFITIPEPIIGGIFSVMFGMIAAVGLSNVQFIDLNSSRNMFVLGFSIFFGLMIPKYFAEGDNADLINTGSDIADQLLSVMLQTSMFISGVLGFFLDNTVPGTDEERGLIKWRAQLEDFNDAEATGSGPKVTLKTYDLPFGMDYIRGLKFSKYVPFLPTYDEKAVSQKLIPKRFRKNE